MEIPAVNLKAIVLVHWLLTVWACMSWLPSSFAWGNFGVLAVGVWAIAQRDSIDAVLMFLFGLVLTILTDIVHFGIFYPMNDYAAESRFRFSAAAAITSLLLKPASCFFVYQMYHERGGDYNVNFGFPSVSQNREAYQSIDPQDECSSSSSSSAPPLAANPFNQAQDGKAAVRAY
ncbi:type-1 angiotensin II receptor-associated protein isoform X1 [Pseudoliparis swirei]|uniref:type-1 angiotensin II receptor-associated protein isoform X1 n=1 Tax=Pseudoliparis swirei TaxID=2059687 RepID=UPI0024BEB820|nr:type-1 angiotensin II receptor-associated protein isoform X1 [Pseudoliparis swirei]